MGTRCEIWLRQKYDGKNEPAVVDLWKHWDGYPEAMIPLFENFVKFVAGEIGDQGFWLCDPIDAATWLIVFDYLENVKERKKLEDGCDYSLGIKASPDIRPRGEIRDAEWTWILDLPNNTKDAKLIVKGYNIEGMDKRIRNGTEEEPEEFKEIPVPNLKQSGVIAGM